MKPKKNIPPQETIFEMEHRLKEEAKILAKKFKDKKPTKFDLK
ncbi:MULTISPECIES: hypothetical protein [Flavobacterium]|nr:MULTISPECIES: hypothetical protein [Flavobacterium]